VTDCGSLIRVQDGSQNQTIVDVDDERGVGEDDDQKGTDAHLRPAN